jgi:hypothetical protein
MRKVLCLILLSPLVAHADEIDNIVKNAIVASRPCEVPRITKDCTCDNCTCDNCQCKPGVKCDNNGCTKKLQEVPVKPCRVSVNGKLFTVENMSPSEAMAAIKAQGDVVVFLNRYNQVVAPPIWYSVPMVREVPMVRDVPVIRDVPTYIREVPGSGIGLGFGFQGPFGGGFQFKAGAG